MTQTDACLTKQYQALAGDRRSDGRVCRRRHPAPGRDCLVGQRKHRKHRCPPTVHGHGAPARGSLIFRRRGKRFRERLPSMPAYVDQSARRTRAERGSLALRSLSDRRHHPCRSADYFTIRTGRFGEVHDACCVDRAEQYALATVPRPRAPDDDQLCSACCSGKIGNRSEPVRRPGCVASRQSRLPRALKRASCQRSFRQPHDGGPGRLLLADETRDVGRQRRLHIDQHHLQQPGVAERFLDDVVDCTQGSFRSVDGKQP
jgi:hypothetical protein